MDIIARLKPEDMEDLPTREIQLSSSLDELDIIYAGTDVELKTELINFMEDDEFEVIWEYSPDGENYYILPDENNLIFNYTIDHENAYYIWRITVVLQTLNGK